MPIANRCRCERVTVTLKHSKIHAEDCAECETKAGMLDQIDRVITMEGALDAEQRGEADGNRRQMSGASHPDLGDSYRDARGGLTSHQAAASGLTRSAPRRPAAVPSKIPATATNEASASVESPVRPCPTEQP